MIIEIALGILLAGLIVLLLPWIIALGLFLLFWAVIGGGLYFVATSFGLF